MERSGLNGRIRDEYASKISRCEEPTWGFKGKAPGEGLEEEA